VQELELKVDLSKSDVDRLAAEFAGGDLGIGPATTEELKTVYFDTPKHDLHAAGISFRLRRQDGGWLQTVKVEDRISNPIELQSFVEEERPNIGKIADKKVRRAVQKAVTGTSLRSVSSVPPATSRSTTARSNSPLTTAKSVPATSARTCARRNSS